MINRHNHLISFFIFSFVIINTPEGWASSETKQSESSLSKQQKEGRHIVTINIESSGTIIIDHTKFTAEPQRSKNLSRAVSTYGEETVVDIRPSKYTPMKDVYDVLIAIGGSGCYKFMLEGREYEIPANLTSPDLSTPMTVLAEIGPPGKDPATGKAIHAGVVIFAGLYVNDMDLSIVTEHLRSMKKSAGASQSLLSTDILPENEALYGRVVHVLDACAEAGIDFVTFSIAFEPRDYSVPEKRGRKNNSVHRLHKRIVSESSKSQFAMPEIIGRKGG